MDRKTFYKDRAYYDNIQTYIYDCCKKFNDKRMCMYLVNGTVENKTYGDLYDAMIAIGTHLLKFELQLNHIALLGKTSFEWISAYLGALCYGFVVIPLDKALPSEEILRDTVFSDSELLIYDEEYSDIAQYIIGNSDVCKHIISIEEIKSIIIGGKTNSFENHFPIVPSSALSEIVFTSGTTGSRKGVMLSSGNIASSVMFGIRLVDMNSEDIVLSIMPNNHTYELSVGILTPMYFGMTIAINDSLKHFRQNFTLFHPTTMIVVPSLLNMMKNEIIREIKKAHKERKFFNAKKLSHYMTCFGIDIRRKVFAKIIDSFGGRIKSFICGGAFLSEELRVFFEDIGIGVIQGYGITECSPIVSCNTDHSSKELGEIGPYCDVKCINGEICVSGSNVMMGYYKNEEETNKVIINGWFHTGDLGAIDNNNFLSLSGRLKNIIVNSNGENISPEEIENHLSFIDIISAAVVFGENDLIAVEIYPNYKYASSAGITKIEEEIYNAIAKVNKTLSKKHQIERIHIRNTPFEMTTSMKVKRNKQSLDSNYSEND